MQNLKTYREETYPVSYCDKYADFQLPDSTCVLAQNCFLDDRKIKQRTGYSMIGNDTGENKPNLGFGTYEQAGTRQLLKINDDATSTAANLFYWTGSGNWVKVASPTFTAGQKCSMVQAMGKMYIVNGVDTPKSWNGTTLANVSSIPIGTFLRWFHNHLFVFMNSRMFISAKDAPESFPTGSLMDFSPDDGDVIVGAATIKDELIVCKRFRSYSFQGWTEVSFDIDQANEKLATFGATSFDAFANTGNDLFFLSFGGDIPHIRSIARTKESDTIYGGIMTDYQEGTMRGLSKGQLDKAAAVFDGRKAWFFLPDGSSTYNNLALAYDSVNNGVTKHTGIYAARAVVSNVTGTKRVYFADSRNSKVYVFDNSYTDNGAAIEMRYLSRRFQPDFKRYFKWKYLFLQYDRDSQGSLRVGTSVDRNPVDIQETVPLTPPVTAFPFTFPITFETTSERELRIELPYSTNSNIQLELYKNDVFAPATVYAYSFMGIPKPIRDLP